MQDHLFCENCYQQKIENKLKLEKVIVNESFETFFKNLQDKYTTQEISYFQSNVEGELINEIQRVGFSYDGIIFNPGGYTHTSVAIGDAVAAVKTPVIDAPALDRL